MNKMLKTYNCCEVQVEHAPRWVIHNSEDFHGIKKKHKED